MSQVTPEMYARVFENHAEGRLILEDMVKRFCRTTYVRGGHEADRESCYRSGMRDVIEHIMNQINIASGEDDAYVDAETRFDEYSGV